MKIFCTRHFYQKKVLLVQNAEKTNINLVLHQNSLHFGAFLQELCVAAVLRDTAVIAVVFRMLRRGLLIKHSAIALITDGDADSHDSCLYDLVPAVVCLTVMVLS